MPAGAGSRKRKRDTENGWRHREGATSSSCLRNTFAIASSSSSISAQYEWKRERERERERENTYEISSTAFLQDSATEEDAERCDLDACWFLALDCDSLQCAIAP